MSKPLFYINKNNVYGQDEVKSSLSAGSDAASESGGSSQVNGGHHDFIAEGGSQAIMGSEIAPNFQNPEYNPELSEKNWDKAKENQRWDSSPLGRGLIRFESRAGFGSLAFAAGSWYVTKGHGMDGYSKNLSLAEINPTKPLQYIAKAVDTFVATPIKYTAKIFGASEAEAEAMVRTRPTRYLDDGIPGRSLGKEVVMISTDFSAASIGDAFGRDLANLADKHVKHDWIDDKGHVDFGKASKALGKTLWRYVSYNGGEDWAVAVPYTYFMKGQRNVINKLHPGFNLDFDRSLNGGSFKVNEHGKVTGNYLAAGMMDLQGRFTAYNVGTLMYREAYNYVANKIHGKNVVLYGSPDDENHKKHGVLHDAGNLAKWVARSTVKGVIYMTPSVPFFSIFRSPQTKTKGLFINPDNQFSLGYKKLEAQGSKHEVLHADELVYGGLADALRDGRVTRETLPPVKFRKLIIGSGMESVGGNIHPHPLSDPNFSPYKLGEGSRILNKIGQIQDNSRVFARGLNNTLGKGFFTNRSVDTYVNSAWAYTPYMYAKAESAILWDDGKMDASAERMIDGAADLNWKEFKAGAGEVWRSILHKPLKDPKREAYALKRISEDSSAADSLTSEQAYYDAVSDISESPLSWKQRVIQGHSLEKPYVEKQPYSSHAEQEAMRKALQEMQPPTNSIH